MEMTTSVSSPLYKKAIKDKIITGSITKSKKTIRKLSTFIDRKLYR